LGLVDACAGRAFVFLTEHAFLEEFIVGDSELVVFEEEEEDEEEGDEHAEEADVPEESEGEGLGVVDVLSHGAFVGQVERHGLCD